MKIINGSSPPSRAQSVIAKAEQSGDEARRHKIVGWIAALKTAEDAAKAKAGARKRIYQVNFRIKNITGTTTGTYDQRRGALVELLESLPVNEKHTSTSTWRMELHIEKATDLAKLLVAPLAKVDFLSVAEVTANRARFGDADLV